MQNSTVGNSSLLTPGTSVAWTTWTGSTWTGRTWTHVDEEEEPGSADNYKTITYILIGIIGALGNCFVVLVLGSSRTLRSKIPNILIIHQSVVDGATSLLLVVTSTNTYGSEGGHYGWTGQLYCRIWAMKVSSGSLGTRVSSWYWVRCLACCLSDLYISIVYTGKAKRATQILSLISLIEH